MTEINKKQHTTDVRVMNYLLQAIPNDIYNSVDACKNAKEIWEQIKRLMFGYDVTNHVKHSRLMDEFEKFAAKEGESLEYVYERLKTLVNIMDRNNVRPIPVSINTKFLNCLQPEWSKYVTMFSTPTNNCLSTSSIIRNQAVIQDGRVDIQTKNAGYDGNGNRNARRQNRNQSFNAGNRNDEIFIMARIQPANDNTVTKPNYDAKAVSEVNASHKVHEQANHVKRKNIIHIADDDQIDSNIVFDDPYVKNNGGTSEHDSNAHNEYHDIQILELETCKEWVKTYESNMIQCSKYKETCEELEREIRADKDTIKKILKEKDKIESDFFKIENEKIIIQHETQLAKKAFKEQETRYLEDIIYLEKKLSSHDRIVYKIGQSIQTIHMLGKTPNKVYDPFSKLGVESSNSVRRPKSKDNKSKNRVLKNINDKRSSAHVRKVSSSVSINSNKRKTMNSTVCQPNASVLNNKIVNVVNDGSNIVCISCGKDVFMLSHEICVARYAFSRDSRVKRALFTTPVAVKSRNLGATSVVAKSRFSVAKTQQQQIKSLIVDSGCSKHMTGNLKLLRNFIQNSWEQSASGTITSQQSLDMEIMFKNLEGDDLLTGSLESNLYTISISELAASSPVCLMSKATSRKSWLWHRRLSHLNFGTINPPTSKDLVDGLLKFKYDKDHLCLAYEQRKSKKASFPPKLVPSTELKLELLHMDLCWPMRNRSLVHTRYNKTPYELIQGTKPNVQYFHMFGSLCYLKNDRDDLRKMKSKSDIGIFIGYAESSRGFRIYNRRTKKIMETTHVKFDELTAMASEYNNSRPDLNYSKFQDSSEELNEILSQQVLYKLFGPLDAPQMVTSSEESIIQESSIPILETHSDEQIQEDVAKLTGILSCILLKFLSSKKLSHLQTIRTRQTCTSSINNIAH
ncbi:retrovirus-related pol polyprotein from transposon TNT 1-94 [Tanacetum coccineum]